MEVESERTEYTSTTANPDGTFTLTQNTTPQRARGKDGAWHAIDTTLVRRPDGSVGPKSAVADLGFSGGGDGKGLIRLGHLKGSMSLGWPGSLPEPKLSGAQATYPEVLPGVDLQLTAEAEGFRQVLVVKSAQAAANPALEQIRLTSSGDGLQIVPGADRGIRAIDADGNAVFSGPSGLMWDSAGTPAEPDPTGPAFKKAAPQRAATEGGSPQEEGTHPDAGDVKADLPVQVGQGSVTVKPDLNLLRGQKTVYPVYIDPPVGLDLSERTVLSSDGDRFWNFNGDYGVGNCSQSGPYYCDRYHVNRMFFEFAPTKLAGKQVVDATFRAYETWSWDCTARLVNLTRTDNISEGTRWPGPAYRDLMADRWISAGRGDLCSPSQPDSWVEFHDNPAEPDENLTASVRDLANGKFSRLTLRLSAGDEGDPDAWKRFDDNAQLQVVYVPKPGVPSKVGIIPNNGAQQYCSRTATAPTTVTIPSPIVQAAVETAVQPTANEAKGELQAEFEIERSSNGQPTGAWSKFWSDYRPKPGWHADGTLEKAPTAALADGGLYRYKARTESHLNYAGKNTELWSAYTPWCYFTYDAGAPKAPVITSGGPYTQCTATLCEGKGGPGVPGTFTFQPNAADKDIKSYRWRLMTSDQAGATTVAGSLVTVKNVTPSLSGTYVLSVEASDLAAGRVRWGAPAEYTFKVQSPQGPVGQWRFDDSAPGATGITAKDTATDGTRHDVTLRQPVAGTAATWSALGRRGVDIQTVNDTEVVRRDYSLRLNDDLDDPAKRLGYASSAGAPVNSKDSFTLSAWVLLEDDTVNHAVAAAPGTYGSAFTLYYSKDYKRWVFNRTATDAQSNPVYLRSVSAAPPVKHVWTHLTGVFDNHNTTAAGDDTIQLFVNGRPQGAPVNLTAGSAAYTPWVAAGDLQIGRSRALGAYQEYFLGRIDEMRVWQRALSPAEVLDESRMLENSVPQAALVGYWDAAGTTNNVVPEWTSYPVDGMALSPSGATANPEDNEVDLDGTSGYLSTTGPAVDETGAFTVTATVRLDKAKLGAKPVGYRAAVFSQANPGNQESSWSLWVEKMSAEGDGAYVWSFSRTAVNAAGEIVETTSAKDEWPAVLDTWSQVTGVYDGQNEPGSGNTHLYIGDVEQPGAPAFTALSQGTGVLSVGGESDSGKIGRFLPGALDNVRIWAGAMTAEQVRTKVLGTPGES
ncbi:LamG-like jellyroll fold domain-containing protein [Streptomyces sp. NPDC004111]|uniref:LamG-like jellyroll fold domain-containing protein n=1 Tax=Streptomyces sp. NPDC004111 TaxID=3364690 RepID=UPI0036754EDC